VNRVIALFDNDAAAMAAMRVLRKAPLPKRVVAMRLPDLPVLESYPTLGSTGLSLRTSMEWPPALSCVLEWTCFGTTVASYRPSNGGYERSVCTYQSEPVGKQEVQARFQKKLVRARKDRLFCENADWSALRAIFSEIFKAFHTLDGEMLSAQLKYFVSRELSAAASVGVRVPIAAEFPLAEVAKAHERLETGHVLGKIVLRVR
jgi:Zinc-binding dehydrogenase